jgi:radical SAM protein with 4Fe4S-binding SPASM domain
MPNNDVATRDCTYAWTHIEIKANGDVRPCCARDPVGNLSSTPLTDILEGGDLRALRASLLSGRLDSDCAACRLRPMTSCNNLTHKVWALMQEVTLPQLFDDDLYLAANRDIAEVGVDPVEHFLHYGRFEGRPLYPTGKD